ncbi:hypothetical protein C6503_13790 [Candidatus Poribacteria bacterium]|nr:MAG: hypothetical protein C6503_13790 [Candidatus Poribacteria bacterium]
MGLHGGLIRVWDVETRTLLHRFRTGNASSPTNFTFTPDGKTLVSGGWDGTVLVWNLENILQKNR